MDARINKALLVVCALLGMVIAAELWLGAKPIAMDSTASTPIQKASEPKKVRDFPAMDEYSQFVDRPLFISTREPVELSEGQEEAPVNKGPAPNTRDMELSGVSLFGNIKIAIIKNKRQKRFYRVKEGEPYEGWTVQEIRAEDILLNSRQGQRTLALVRKGDQRLATKAQNRRKLKAAQGRQKQASPSPMTKPKPKKPRPATPRQSPEASAGDNMDNDAMDEEAILREMMEEEEYFEE